jgi:uncharacterized protein (DUF1684 family)
MPGSTLQSTQADAHHECARNGKLESSPGAVKFEVDGEYRIDAITERAAHLFMIVSDKTSGKDTYPAGRYSRRPARRSGRMVIDFNKAFSPPRHSRNLRPVRRHRNRIAHLRLSW